MMLRRLNPGWVRLGVPVVSAALLCGCENAAGPTQAVRQATPRTATEDAGTEGDGLRACDDPELKPVEPAPGVGTLTGGYPSPAADPGIRLARPFPLVDPRSPLPVVTIPDLPLRPLRPMAAPVETDRSTEQGPTLRAADDDAVEPLPAIEPLPAVDLPGQSPAPELEQPLGDLPPLSGISTPPVASPAAAPTRPGPSVVRRESAPAATQPAPSRGAAESARTQLLHAARGQSPRGQAPRGVAPRGVAVGTAAHTPSMARPASAPRAAAAPPSDAMQAVTHRAELAIQRGYDLAGRGALYSARAEFIQALRTIAQALDLRAGDRRHSEALAAGLKALDEAEDFVPPSTSLESDFDVAVLIRAHDTPVCKGIGDDKLLPVLVLRQYYNYAQQQLVVAVGGEEAASMALFGLGKTFGTLAEQQTTSVVAAEPKAMVFHQAALTTHPGNFLAANELAVLTARFGEYATARALLQYSASLSPHSAVWRNLSLVHERLGEPRLAQLARREAELALARETSVQPGNREGIIPASDVQWVDPATFASSGQALADMPPPAVSDQPKPSPAAGKTQRSASGDQGRSASWWKWWSR
jgi:tetratricopeptide (TPR) repeat protein